MTSFRFKLLSEPKIELDICDCFTSATMAKKLYFSKYYPQVTEKKVWKSGQCVKTRQYVHQVGKATDKYIRDSYQGGRCDIYKYGHFQNNKFYYYDFTSLYPAVARQMLPIGNPVLVQGKDIDIKKFFGYIRCRLKTNNSIIPLHGYKYEGKLVFGQHEATEMTLFSEEIKRGIELGNTYEFIDGQQFDKAPVMKQFMQEGFELKAASKACGQSVMEKTWKIMINSGYGFWGIGW
jgi:hypothetical protein